MSASQFPLATSGAALSSGKSVGAASAGGDLSPQPDLGHWVYGDKLHLCLTPTREGLIRVRIVMPASATGGTHGVHLNSDDGHLITEFEPRELAIDYATSMLRGTRMTTDLTAAFRVGFELDLEPGMVHDTADALRCARQLARLLRSQLFESLGI